MLCGILRYSPSGRRRSRETNAASPPLPLCRSRARARESERAAPLSLYLSHSYVESASTLNLKSSSLGSSRYRPVSRLPRYRGIPLSGVRSLDKRHGDRAEETRPNRSRLDLWRRSIANATDRDGAASRARLTSSTSRLPGNADCELPSFSRFECSWTRVIITGALSGYPNVHSVLPCDHFPLHWRVYLSLSSPGKIELSSSFCH